MSSHGTQNTRERSSVTELGSSATSFTSTNARNVVTREDVERKPWKYVGYRGYSDLIASEDDFFILRRFNSLNVRIALLFQDEIAVLEGELAEIDEQNSRKDAADVHNGSFRQDIDNRSEVLTKIRKKLEEYNAFVLQQTEMKKLQKPRKQDFRSLRNWHHNHDYAAIAPDEQKYLEHESDLFGVIPKDKLPLRRFIDNSRRLRTLPIWQLKGKSVSEENGGDDVSYFSDARINAFAAGLIIGLGGILLLAPLWILYALNSSAHKLAVITLFVAAFLITLSFTLVMKPFEALGATAAYAAVLTVFLQVGTSSL
ncbi:hypothetical protein F5Y16DRAFT_266644 [Xylariaceae sp. FL0255]|nr:hypothetical protein F5Y16DRAFT_266644 [Xylariaceae sp. FL0255]